MIEKTGGEKEPGKFPAMKMNRMEHDGQPEKKVNSDKTEMFFRLLKSGVDIGFVFHEE